MDRLEKILGELGSDLSPPKGWEKKVLASCSELNVVGKKYATPYMCAVIASIERENPAIGWTLICVTKELLKDKEELIFINSLQQHPARTLGLVPIWHSTNTSVKELLPLAGLFSSNLGVDLDGRATISTLERLQKAVRITPSAPFV